MARDYEQGVVNPDPEADQHPEDGHETGHCEDVGHEAGEGEPDPDGNERGDDRDHSGQDGAKKDPKDDQGKHDAETGAVGGLLRLGVLDRLAAQRDLER